MRLLRLLSSVLSCILQPCTHANTDKKLKINKLNVTLCEGEYFRNSFNLQTIRNISKKASNKSCSELNFPQKARWTRISTFPRSGAGGLQRFPFLTSYMYWNGEVGSL